MPRSVSAAWRGPLAAGALALVAMAFSPAYSLDVLTAAAIQAIYVVSWVAFSGPSKEIALGHGLFIGMASYAAAMVQTVWGWPPWLALVTGAATGVVGGGFVGLVTLRHRGLYFSMITMALQATFYRLLFLNSGAFGGEEGIIGVRAVVDSRGGVLLVAVGALAAAAAIAILFLRSQTGLDLAAVGQHEELARAVGVRVNRARLAGLLVCGGLAGFGAALYATTQGQANAELAGEAQSIRVALLGLLGGSWSIGGAIAASVVIAVVDLFVGRLVAHPALVSMAILLLLTLALRHGLVPMRPRWRWRQTRTAERPAASPSTPAASGLRVEGVSVRVGGHALLHDVSFALSGGSAAGLIGPNGAGKSTLLDVLSGRRRPSSGTILWRGQKLRDDPAANVRRGIVRVFQQPACFAALTFDEHLRAAGADAAAPGVGLLIDLASAADQRGRPLGDLPTSTVRLCQVAMALGRRPQLLLLDEPFAALSRRDADIMAAALAAAIAAGLDVLIVEHRLGELFARVERVLVLCRGRLIADAAAADVLARAEVRAAYGLVSTPPTGVPSTAS